MAAETRLVGGGLSSLPRVNLLPPEIAEQAQLRKIQMGLAGAVALAVAAMGFLYVGASDSVSTAQDQLTAATAEQADLNAQKADLADVTAVYAQAAAAQQLLTQAMGQEVRYSRFLSDLSLSIPDNVWVKSAVYTQASGTAAVAAAGAAAAGATGTAGSPTGIGTLTVTGVAYVHDDVANWLDSLAKTAGLESPTLQSSTRALIGKKSVVEWSSTVNLSTKALSGRYVTAVTATSTTPVSSTTTPAGG